MNLSVVLFFGEKGEDLWEYDYIIEDLLPKCSKNIDFVSYSNVNTYSQNCDVFVYSCRDPKNFHWGFMPDYNQVLEAVKKLKPKIVIQLSDEFEHEDNSAHNNLANYCQLFLRNYHHSNYSYSDNTLHIPLGHKNDFDISGKKITPVLERKYNWCFVGQKKSDRQDLVNSFSSIPDHYCLIHDGDEKQKIDGNQIADYYLNSIFVPCSRGWTTLNTMRIYEASMCGAIPVVVGTKDEIYVNFKYEDSPPFIFSYTWEGATSICKSLLENPEILIERQKNILKWWNTRMDKIKIKISEVLNKEENPYRTIVQIGANYGDDDLANYIKKNCLDIDFALFVEANQVHIPALKECYKNYKNAIIENIAVKLPHVEDDELTIFYHTNDGPQYGISSCDINHILKHVEFVPYLKDGEIKSFKVPCVTMEELFDKYGIKELDWLLLDVEGIDAELLLSFNWKKYKIKRVEVEHLHLGEYKEQIANMFVNMGYVQTKALHEYDWAFEIKTSLNKLKNIPSINCISLQESEDRRKLFLEQFKEYGVEHKVKFHISEKFGEVKDVLEFDEGFEDKSCDGNKSIFVAHLKNIKNWYDNTDEEYALFCEDDLSLEPVQYWNFTWEDFVEHLPNDWECVQLSYTGETFSKHMIRLQKRKWYFWGNQALLIKREYAKKLLDFYYKEDRIIMKVQDREPFYYKGYSFFPDFHLYPYAETLLLRGIGNVYCLPLFAENVEFEATFHLNNPDFYKEKQKPGHYESHTIAIQWWKDEGHKKSIQELTTMIKIIDYFPYFNETGRELLDFRINLLKDHVDQFVICESNRTHSGSLTKPGLRDAIEYYNLPKEKIRIVDLIIPGDDELVIEGIDYLNCHEDNSRDINSLRARVRERMQKDAIMEVIDDYDDDCMIIHGDSDEIPNPNYIKDIKNTLLLHPNGYVKIPLSYHEGRADLRLYDKNTNQPVHWAMFAANISIFKKTTPIKVRSDNEVPPEFYLLRMIDPQGKVIEDMGWHFSWMGNNERRTIKAKAFAHYNDNLSFLSNSRYENQDLSGDYVDGSLPPCGNVNYILRDYPISNLPKLMVETPRMKEFFMPERTVETSKLNLTVSQEPKTSIIVCENFYEDPYAVREYALSLDFEESDYHRGRRTPQQHIFPGIKEKFEQLLGKKIVRWNETYGMCGRFQYCTAEDAIVYHGDAQQWAAVIYLTPDAPYETGTSLLVHKKTGTRHCSDPRIWDAWKDTAPTGLYLDGTPWDEIDKVGNVFNRLIIWDGHCPHAASKYFGFAKETSRLFHIFFFDTDDTPSWVN